VVLGLYELGFQGAELGADEYIISADETSIQARCRCHLTLPQAKARMMRVQQWKSASQ
jgi:hypothetical protein